MPGCAAKAVFLMDLITKIWEQIKLIYADYVLILFSFFPIFMVAFPPFSFQALSLFTNQSSKKILFSPDG